MQRLGHGSISANLRSTGVTTDIIGGHDKQGRMLTVPEDGLADDASRTVGWDQNAGIVKTISVEHRYSR